MEWHLLLISPSLKNPISNEFQFDKDNKVVLENITSLEDFTLKMSENVWEALIFESPFYASHIEEFSCHLKNTPFFLINKLNVDSPVNSAVLPIKEFNESYSDQLLKQIVETISLLEKPNYMFFNQLGDDSLKDKMIELMKIEFNDFIRDMPLFHSNNQNHELFHLIHKISSKFSILGMPNTYKLIKKLEKKISEEQRLTEKEISDLETISKNVKNFLELNS